VIEVYIVRQSFFKYCFLINQQEAGLLKGKRATTWAGGERDMQRAYPEVQVQEDVNFILDGNILTSNGGVVSYQAALKLLEEMSSSARAKAIEETLQFNRIR